MPVEPPRIYWDSDIFLHYVEQTPAWAGMLDGIVETVRNGRAMLVTSTLAMAEVAYAESERSAGFLPPDEFTPIDDMWADSSIVLIVEVDPPVALLARAIVRRGKNENRTLRAADAIHLATAVRLGVSDFHTLDAGLQRWNNEWFPVRPPTTVQPALFSSM